MPQIQVAYLGPIGTYSHLVAEKRFGRRAVLLPFPTVMDVCAFVAGRPSRFGIVPIENSSGGAIHETVDILLANEPRVHIEAELSLNVRLALLGRKGQDIRKLYSHAMPLEHCVTWLKRHLSRAEREVVTSTAAAAIHAASEVNAGALGHRRLAAIYGLDVLEYPVAADVPNLTVFYVIGGRKPAPPRRDKTTLAVKLPNRPGSLCTFLEAFRAGNVNLSRLISRPIRGSPREYAFLVDVLGGADGEPVRRALARARKTAVEVRVVGSYPALPSYSS
jgi:chorismate mutase/prephenate dehydratase